VGNDASGAAWEDKVTWFERLGPARSLRPDYFSRSGCKEQETFNEEVHGVVDGARLDHWVPSRCR
jgi:hypothetical protein